jgi:acetyl esterase/lipase
MLPLCLGHRLNILTKFISIPTKSYSHFHRQTKISSKPRILPTIKMVRSLLSSIHPSPPQTTPPGYTDFEAQRPDFAPEASLILQAPPTLDPAWLEHEERNNLKDQPEPADPKAAYSEAAKARNARMLAGRDKHLTEGIKVHDTFLEFNPMADSSFSQDAIASGSTTESTNIPIRSYSSELTPDSPLHPLDESDAEGADIVVYYHGGGLFVGDLDCEDLSCRRIVKETGCTVYSVDYRLMPEFSADVAVSDAIRAFQLISSMRKARRLIVMGSSSGGQLAAMVSQHMRDSSQFSYPPLKDSTTRRIDRKTIDGVLLRGPVTCNASDAGTHLPTRFRAFHTSLSPAFYTSLASETALNAANRTTGVLPLEGNLVGLPRHWIQICTNDIYYSDGALYAEGLREVGVDVELDVVEGFPHTFWLKAPELERALAAER